MLRKLKNFYHLGSAVLAVILYKFPARNLTIIGVTGTDGKTTTVHLIGSILRHAGFKVAVVSTIEARLGEERIETGFHVTTPSSFLIQKLLRRIADKGFTHVVLEATSHGLDQHRLFGCNFKVGVITNVTHDHLDYHGTYEKYLEVKSKLFDKVRLAVLNKDDKSYKLLNSKCKILASRSGQNAKLVTYGLSDGDITPNSFKFKTRLLGEHNTYNCLAAIAATKILGIDDQVIRQAVADFPGLPGRLEEVNKGQNFKVFVDFGHTPAAFEKVIPALRKITKGEIIHVFGCTGDRDRHKRPIMGEISARLSDKIILTQEDTYSENPENILFEIEPGVVRGGKILDKSYWKVLDRSKAIKKAVEMAKQDDTVLITGVGHQTSLNIGGKEILWSDQEEAKKAILGSLK